MITSYGLVTGLTITRIALSFPLIICLINEKFIAACFILIVSALTDFLDGFIARKYSCQTVLGAKLDPLADKIITVTALLWICKTGLVPLWAIWIIIIREIIISAWRSDSVNGRPASFEGKAKTALQFLSIFFIVFPGDIFFKEIIRIDSNYIGLMFFWPSLILTISSGGSYFIRQINPHQS